MPALSTFSAISVAFLLGCCACLLPVWQEHSEPVLVQLPHQSAMPVSGLGDAQSAYQSIPHRRTTFRPGIAAMDRPQSDYLQLVFASIDEAIVIRVAALRALLSEDSAKVAHSSARSCEAYEELIEFVKQIPAPHNMQKYHKLLVSAMQDQVTALREMHQQSVISPVSPQEWMSLAAVRRSSSSLHKAYKQLMSEYPNQPASNCNAFFDYHCALDFK